jgi:ELWxxDGT repeat protein
MNGLMAFNNALYLSIPLDAAKGRELYKYDGTSLSLVADINPGSTDSDPKSLTIFNGNLYFTAANSSTGRELYKLGSAAGIQNIAWGGSVTLYPNPATSSSVLSVTVAESQELTVSLLDVQGKVVFTTGKEPFAAGQHSIKLPLDNLASGQYFYQLNDKAGHPVASGTLSKQ